MAGKEEGRNEMRKGGRKEGRKEFKYVVVCVIVKQCT